ncbi:MAG: TonB-dependent receptor [Pseudomonadota bacterium]
MAQIASGDNILVTATRTAKPLAEIFAQATIINREDIDAAAWVSLSDLLQRRAGVEIRTTGGPGQPSSVFIRGANGAHTLVLVDGQRIGSSTSGATALENIPLDLIERIEVVKGPQSGLYGSDAIGGVVQIFTRHGSVAGVSGNVGFVKVGTGSYDARNLTAALHAVTGDTTYTLGAGVQKINAPSATNPAAGSFTFNPDRDPYENTHGKIGIAHRFSATDRVTFDVWQSRGKANFDNGPGAAETANNQMLSGGSLKSDHEWISGWKSRIAIGQTIDDSRVMSDFPGTFKTRQNQYGWQNDFSVGTGEATAGLERHEEKVASTTNYNSTSRSTDALFFAATQKFDVVSLSANVRHDREKQFGNRTTGGATAGFQLTPSQLLYVSAASAFRAPSFNDLYYPGFSNARLQAEKSHSAEMGWRMTQRDVRIDAAYFDNKIDNLIAFDFVTFTPQNIQRARICGIEAGMETTLFGIDWRLQFTSQGPKNTLTDKQLRSRARAFGTLGASQTVGAWRWRIDVLANGLRFDSADESSGSRMGGYTLLNASLRYVIDHQWRIEVIGHNLGNRTYALAQGYNQLGRQVLLNIKFTSK